MARKVFFSFHYDRDVRRVVQIRNSWVVRPGDEAQPFYDKAEFEKAKARAGGIEKWIEQQLSGTSVTVVLFGAETYDRDWVKHEIKRSYELGKGMLAIDIFGVKDPQKGVDVQGRNPLEHWKADGVPFMSRLQEYGRIRYIRCRHIPSSIRAAAKAGGR